MHEESERITVWRMVILILSLYVLCAVFADTVLPLSGETRALLITIDNLVCGVFIADFTGRVLRGPDRKRYLKWGWIDLVSSIPTVQVLRWGRIVRVVRIIRILRGVRSTRHLLAFLFENRVKGTLAFVGMVCFVLVVFSSVAILNCETVEEANIKTAGDALWWSFVTMATVGYGDYYPTTPGGRFLAAALMTAGIVLFGTFTALPRLALASENQPGLFQSS